MSAVWSADGIAVRAHFGEAAATGPSHVSHAHLTAPPGPRRMKHTIANRYSNTVSPFLENGIMPEWKYKQTIDQIHTDAVAQVVDTLDANPILETKPPAIDKSHPMPSAQSAGSIGTLSGTSSVAPSTSRLGVLIYKTVSDRLVTRQQPREMDFMGRTALTGSKFIYLSFL